jgi:hypothetical protein
VYLGTDTGSVLFWNGERTRGTTFPTQAGVGLRAVFGVSPTELYVGGEGGRIFRFDGTTWTRELLSTGAANAILSIHRGASGLLVAAGSGGVLVQRNAVTRVWTPISLSPPAAPSFRRVHVAEPFVFAVTDVGQVYRGTVGSTQVSPLGPPVPAGFLTEQTSAAFSSDAGFLVVAGGTAGPMAGRAMLLDLSQASPTWVPIVDLPALPFSAVEVREPRVFFAGERGNAAVVTLQPDGGALVQGPLLPMNAPLFRSIIPVSTDEVILGGQSGVMGFLSFDGGAVTITDNDFGQNRFETLNDGCATAGVVAGTPVVFVTAAGNRIGSRANRWSWQSGGSGGLGFFEWSRCHVTAQDQAWAIGNDRALVTRLSRVSRRLGTTWTDVDTPVYSERWAAVSGFPDGTTFFLPNGNQLLVNADGGTDRTSFRVVTLDGGPLNDLLALNASLNGAVQGAMNGGNHFVGNPTLQTWNWGFVATPPPNDALAIHGVAQGSGFYSLAVGSAGFIVERRQGVSGLVSRVPGVNDLTDVWVSRGSSAYIATTQDAGTLVGRTSPTVIVRAPDGGTRLEPVPLSQRIRGLFGVDDLDGTTRVWVTGASGAILRRDLPDGG